MDNIKYFFKRLPAVLALIMSLIGAIGGIGYSLYIKEYITAVCIGVLAIMAIPTFIKLFKYIITD